MVTDEMMNRLVDTHDGPIMRVHLHMCNKKKIQKEHFQAAMEKVPATHSGRHLHVEWNGFNGTGVITEPFVYNQRMASYILPVPSKWRGSATTLCPVKVGRCKLPIWPAGGSLVMVKQLWQMAQNGTSDCVKWYREPHS